MFIHTDSWNTKGSTHKTKQEEDLQKHPGWLKWEICVYISHPIPYLFPIWVSLFKFQWALQLSRMTSYSGTLYNLRMRFEEEEQARDVYFNLCCLSRSLSLCNKQHLRTNYLVQTLEQFKCISINELLYSPSRWFLQETSENWCSTSSLQIFLWKKCSLIGFEGQVF